MESDGTVIVENYDGDFTKTQQTIADGGKVELRTNFNSSNYILEPSRIEENYVTFNTIDKNANITIKVTEYGINDVSYIDLNSGGEQPFIITCDLATDTDEMGISNVSETFANIYQACVENKNVELRMYVDEERISYYSLIPSTFINEQIIFSMYQTHSGTSNIGISVFIASDDTYGIVFNETDLSDISGATINDAVTSTNSTWSSEKINEEIENSTKSYFTINTLSNTKYIKIIPDNEQRYVTIVSEDGECVEIFGDNDNGDQYIEECPKAIRLSYGEIQSFDASEKTANIERVLYNQTAGSKNFYVDCKSLLGYTIHGVKEQPKLVDSNSAEASQLMQQGLKEMPIISLIPEKDFYRVVAQDKEGYFKFKPSSDGGNEQPLRATATDNYGGMIEISGNAPSQAQYKPFKCVRLSNGTYASYDAANTTNNKMKKLYLYDGYMYLQVETYTTVTFTGLIEAPTFVETLADTSTEIPIVSLVNPSIKAAAGSNINSVGTPSVTASESNGTTTFTFNYLKGAKGDKGDTGAAGSNGTTPTIKAAAGSNINTVGTPSVTASTSGTTTTFTFNNLKGAKGDKGDSGSNGTTPTIKASAGSNIGSVGTPSVSASTSGTTTTFTFNYLKGAKGDKGDTGDDGYTKFPSTPGVLISQGTVCSLSSKQVVVLFCIGSGGGSLSASNYPSGLTFNNSAWSSGSKSTSVGSVYTINNNTSSSVDIKAVYNGGCGFLVFGPM